jgi:hypothetical protein
MHLNVKKDSYIKYKSGINNITLVQNSTKTKQNKKFKTRSNNNSNKNISKVFICKNAKETIIKAKTTTKNFIGFLYENAKFAMMML